jgi:hypothetical protein
MQLGDLVTTTRESPTSRRCHSVVVAVRASDPSVGTLAKLALWRPGKIAPGRASPKPGAKPREALQQLLMEHECVHSRGVLQPFQTALARAGRVLWAG